MKQLYFVIVLTIIFASASHGQVTIGNDDCQTGPSGAQFVTLVLNSYTHEVSAVPATLADNDMPVAPNLVPGTIAANQSIAYNTVPRLLTATEPTGGTPPYGYQWQSSIGDDAFSNILGATTINYQPGALTTTTSFRQIQFSSIGGDSANTNVVIIKVYGFSVADLASAGQSVYPNPTTGNFILELKDLSTADPVKVDIYGMCGEKIITEVMKREGKHPFSLSGRPPGVYFIRLTSDNRVETVKIIKQ
jgi:hypothetical protein